MKGSHRREECGEIGYCIHSEVGELREDSASTEPTHRVITGTGSGLAGVRKPG